MSGAAGGAVSGFVTGGVVGGATSLVRGENIWTGKAIDTGAGVRHRPANVEPDPLPEQVKPDTPANSSRQLSGMTNPGSSKIQDIANRLKPGLRTPKDTQEFLVVLEENNEKLIMRVETHQKVDNVFKNLNLSKDEFVRHANIQYYHKIDGDWVEFPVPGTHEKNYHIFMNIVNRNIPK